MPDQTKSEPVQPSTEPKSFQTPQTPESRDLDQRDLRTKQDEIQGSGARPEDVPEESDPHTEKQLDHGLKETFPASDPVSINPGAD